MTWAQRLKRVFAIDIETCRSCGGKLRVIASIEEPAVIERSVRSGRSGGNILTGRGGCAPSAGRIPIRRLCRRAGLSQNQPVSPSTSVPGFAGRVAIAASSASRAPSPGAPTFRVPLRV
jgi:hypothetical protein